MGFADKIVLDWNALREKVEARRAAGQRMVFTNGCFDLLHYGHVSYLARAAELGDYLLVALNSDASVRKLKGLHRPIQDEHSRLGVMAALGFVEFVTLFSQTTPLELIQLLLPEVLVKGGDWKPEQIVGAEDVLAAGGRVLSLPFVEGYSTTAIEQKIKASVARKSKSKPEE